MSFQRRNLIRLTICHQVYTMVFVCCSTAPRSRQRTHYAIDLERRTHSSIAANLCAAFVSLWLHLVSDSQTNDWNDDRKWLSQCTYCCIRVRLDPAKPALAFENRNQEIGHDCLWLFGVSVERNDDSLAFHTTCGNEMEKRRNYSQIKNPILVMNSRCAAATNRWTCATCIAHTLFILLYTACDRINPLDTHIQRTPLGRPGSQPYSHISPLYRQYSRTSIHTLMKSIKW